MQKSFSPELIARAKRIFERRSSRTMSEEETERYLEALAKLGLLAARVNGVGKRTYGKEVKPCG